MVQTVLIVGGVGRIGRCVARDLLEHTRANVVLTGRGAGPAAPDERERFFRLDLEELERLREAIRGADLVIHCAGPFHYRDGRVLRTCIEEKVNYIDVSDHRSFYQKVIPYRAGAEKAGITAIVNTGIFPGISNSIVREAVESLDRAATIRLNYAVAGSGGAGLTVMRTTFLGLRDPFRAWIGGEWRTVKPYTEREPVEFPFPIGKTGVYWFDMPETYTFAESFPVRDVITKFGSLPDFYNHLTWITAHVFPGSWVKSPRGIEFFSKVSFSMTGVTDRFTGIGVAIRAEIEGFKEEREALYRATMVHEDTARSAGFGTGSVAELLLTGQIDRPGIYPVEQVLPTPLFNATIEKRGVAIDRQLFIDP